MATRPPLPATPASGPTLDEIRNPGRTLDRRLTDAGEGDTPPPPPPEPPPPDPNAFQFFGGTRKPLPGTEKPLVNSFARAITEQNEALKRAKLEEAMRVLQAGGQPQQPDAPPQIPPYLR